MKYCSLVVIFAFATLPVDALQCWHGYTSTQTIVYDNEGFVPVQCEVSANCVEWKLESDIYNYSMYARSCEEEMDHRMPVFSINCKELIETEDDYENVTIGWRLKARCCNTDLCNHLEATTEITIMGSTTQAINPTTATGVESGNAKPLSCYYGGESNGTELTFLPTSGYKVVQCHESKYCVDWSYRAIRKMPRFNMKYCEGEFNEFEAIFAHENVDCKDLIENGNGCKMTLNSYHWEAEMCCCATDLCNTKGLQQTSTSTASYTNLTSKPTLAADPANETSYENLISASQFVTPQVSTENKTSTHVDRPENSTSISNGPSPAERPSSGSSPVSSQLPCATDPIETKTSQGSSRASHQSSTTPIESSTEKPSTETQNARYSSRFTRVATSIQQGYTASPSQNVSQTLSTQTLSLLTGVKKPESSAAISKEASPTKSESSRVSSQFASAFDPNETENSSESLLQSSSAPTEVKFQ